MPWWTFRDSAKVQPCSGEKGEVRGKVYRKPPVQFRVVNLQTVVRRYGGQRHPRIDPYHVFEQSGDLLEWRFVPVGSTVIYISHEWTGTYLPDHDGTQIYHLLRMFKRLQGGEIARRRAADAPCNPL